MGKLRSALFQNYRSVGSIVGRYWRAYGGARALVVSPYFHLSLVVTAVTSMIWSTEKWWDQVVTVIPSLLGFSLSGLAIVLGFGGEKFLDVMRGRDSADQQDESPYIVVAAAFTHFVFVQVLALLLAITAIGLWQFEGASTPWLFASNRVARGILWGLGYWMFVYAICSAAATLFAVFRMATWFDHHKSGQE